VHPPWSERWSTASPL